MPLPKRTWEEVSTTITPTLGCVLAFSLFFMLTAYAADPSWWSSAGTVAPPAVKSPQVVTNAGVVTTNYLPNDYAVVVQGQLKRFTARAVDELNSSLPNGAGTNLNTMVSNWATDYATNGYGSTNLKPSDYSTMTVGQLKYIGNPIWTQLVAAHYADVAPSWLAQNTNTDQALANIGQLKEIFNFQLSGDPTDIDGNGLPDTWEFGYFGYLYNDPNSSPDGNGLTLLQDYQQGNNPTNYYSQNGSIVVPTITLAGGNNQTGPQATFLAQPLSVTITNTNGTPLINAPVSFGASGGQLAFSNGGRGNSTLTGFTDNTGSVMAYYAGPDSAAATNTVQIMAGTATASLTEKTEINDGTIAAPTGITQQPGSVSGQIILNWTNNATNATYILVQQSVDNVNWVTIATLNDPTTNTYTATVPDPSQNYYFGVIAGAP